MSRKEELKDKYSILDDIELLAIVYYDNSSYTDKAIEAAKSVLAERRLHNPSKELLQKAKERSSSLKKIEEMEKDKVLRTPLPELIEIYSTNNVSEAEMLKDIIENNGIQTLIKNKNLGAINAYSIAIGGIKLMVFPDDKEKAEEIISTYFSKNE